MKQFKLLIITIFVLSGCVNAPKENTKSSFPKYSEKVARSKCTEAFILGKRYYDKHRYMRGLDISNFFSAISMLERAKEKCKGHEYEDDVIYSLANAYFYVGEYNKSALNYRFISEKFSLSSFNTGQSTASQEYEFLHECMNDSHIGNYRKAEIYEIHKEFRNAINQYTFAINSMCSEISRRSARKSKLLRYTQD